MADASSSSDPLPEAFPPTDSGVMRGWLGTHTPQPGRLWFVLSAETLSYFESPNSEEPLGMLGVDEMQWVKGEPPLAPSRQLMPPSRRRPAPPRLVRRRCAARCDQ